MNHNTNISSLYVDTNPPMCDLGCVQQSRYDLGSNWVQVAPGGGGGSAGGSATPVIRLVKWKA